MVLRAPAQAPDMRWQRRLVVAAGAGAVLAVCLAFPPFAGSVRLILGVAVVVILGLVAAPLWALSHLPVFWQVVVLWCSPAPTLALLLWWSMHRERKRDRG